MIELAIGAVVGLVLYRPLRKAVQRRQIARGRKALLAHMPDEDRREGDGKR